MKLVFLLADTQQWIDEMSKQVFLTVPIDSKKKLFRKDYWLGITAMAHILERHFFYADLSGANNFFQPTMVAVKN